MAHYNYQPTLNILANKLQELDYRNYNRLVHYYTFIASKSQDELFNLACQLEDGNKYKQHVQLALNIYGELTNTKYFRE